MGRAHNLRLQGNAVGRFKLSRDFDARHLPSKKGMSAITNSLMAVLRAGDHAIFPYTVYGGTHELLVEFFQHWDVDYTFVDATQPMEYAKALRPNTKVVYAVGRNRPV